MIIWIAALINMLSGCGRLSACFLVYVAAGMYITLINIGFEKRNINQRSKTLLVRASQHNVCVIDFFPIGVHLEFMYRSAWLKIVYFTSSAPGPTPCKRPPCWVSYPKSFQVLSSPLAIHLSRERYVYIFSPPCHP